MHHNLNLKIIKKETLNGGFGLIELLVSISIVVLVTSVIMSRQTSYNGAVLLRSQAYQVALEAREVQLSAVSAIGSASNFRNVFGLHFDTANPNYYIVFRDADGDNYYDVGEEVGKRSNIDPRFQISQIRRLVNGTPTTEPRLSVVFERPNFDARFFNFAGEVTGSVVEIDVRVKGTTGAGVGEVRTVEITKTGQIIVQ
jgi:type II secretory pathway pseudopilin PulG